MTRQRPRSEEDLRAAFQLAADNAPDRETVLRGVYGQARPRSFARRFPILAPVGAAAAVLLVAGFVFAVVHSAGPGQSLSSAKGAANAAAGVAGPFLVPSANANASSSAAINVPSYPAPATGSGTSASLVGVCTPSDVTLTIVWTQAGTNLNGTLSAKNTASAACGLRVAPTVTPLGVDGQPLDVRNVAPTDAPTGPKQLEPGATATSHLTWAMWCQRGVGGSAQVNWGTGAATADVQHAKFTPTSTACPDNTESSTLTSTYFSPLS